MGAILLSFFDKAKEKGGLDAQVKLAMITKMSMEKAKTESDSAGNIKLFEDAINRMS